LSGYFLLIASPFSFTGKSVNAKDIRATAFQWGVASADPQPTSVLVWTKVEPLNEDDSSAVLTLQVSLNQDFDEVVLEKVLSVTSASDFTVRAMVKGLDNDTTYYYRFIASDGSVSRIGRTWTAPSTDSRKVVAIAFVSCSTYPPNRYGTLRHLINSEKKNDQREIDLILHLGDYVYSLPEEANEPLVMPNGDSFLNRPIDNGQGNGRQQSAIPAGMGMGAPTPTTLPRQDFDSALAAHRRIYRGYLKDPDLQDARALFPFVSVWDDHEYENDVWQSYVSGVGSEPEKRLAATQAWFEYVPQVLTENPGVDGVPNEAYDYRETTVKNARMKDFDEGFMSLEPNNLAAINSMRCYRTLRWGRHVDLIITDNRSYRGPSANPGFSVSSIIDESGDARAFTGFNLLEGETLNILSKGKTYNNGIPPESVVVKGNEIPNPRIDAPEVSMLGLEQKKWFKSTLEKSEATWKVWGNSVPAMGFRFDPGRLKPEAGNGYLWTDAWDGFPNEREELMKFIREHKINNVLSLSGDRHASYAGLVAENYEAKEPKYVIPDFTCTAISAFTRAPFVARPLTRFGLKKLCVYEQTMANGTIKDVSNLNIFMRMGAKAAEVMADTNDLDEAIKFSNNELNPHLDYADNDTHGYGIARFSSREMEVDFMLVERPDWDPDKFPNGPGLTRIVGYRVKTWKGGGVPKLERLYTRGETVFGES
jgi:alkaline phosphatase D